MNIRRSVCVKFALGVAILAGLLSWAVKDKSANNAESVDEDAVEIDFADDEAEDDAELSDLPPRYRARMSQKSSLDSFCGIEFGAIVQGEPERVKGGRYLAAVVELDTPFRGASTATVYAGVKSKRVFRIEVRDFDGDKDGFGIYKILCKKYGVDVDKLRAEANVYVLPDYFLLHNMDIYFHGGHKVSVVQSGSRWDDSWQNDSCQDDSRADGVYFLRATNFKYQQIADKEYEEESGGDGSSVL